MHTEQLAYIIEISKTGTLSEAAENLHISQSGLSQSLSQLEKELGFRMFYRSRNGCEPTEEGKKMIRLAYEMLDKIEQIKKEARMQQEQLMKGNLRVAAMPALLVFLFRTLSHLKNLYPNVNFTLTEMKTEAILQEVKQNRIDIGFIVLDEQLPKQHHDLHFEKLLRGTIKVMVSKKSPLALNKSITYEQLSRLPIVLYNSEFIRGVIQRLTKQLGPLNIMMTTNSTGILRESLREPVAVSIAPDYGPVTTRTADLVSLELEDVDIPDHHLGWVRAKDAPLSAIGQAFLQHVKDGIAQHQISVGE